MVAAQWILDESAEPDIMKMRIGLTQQTDQLLLAGMAGGKFVTTDCNCRNTFGGCSVSLLRTDYGLYTPTVGSGHAPTDPVTNTER